MVPFPSVHDRLLDQPRALQLYVELKKLAGSRGWASPTPDDLCARFKCSLATTERAIAVLKERRCIRITRRRRGDGTLGRRVFSFRDQPDDGRNDEPSHNSPMTSGRPHLTRDKHHNSRVSSQFVDVQATLDQEQEPRLARAAPAAAPHSNPLPEDLTNWTPELLKGLKASQDDEPARVESGDDTGLQAVSAKPPTKVLLKFVRSAKCQHPQAAKDDLLALVEPEAARLLPNEGDVGQAVARVFADRAPRDVGWLPRTLLLERFRDLWVSHYCIEPRPPSRPDHLKALDLEGTYTARALAFAMHAYFENRSLEHIAHPFAVFAAQAPQWLAVGRKRQWHAFGHAEIYRDTTSFEAAESPSSTAANDGINDLDHDERIPATPSTPEQQERCESAAPAEPPPSPESRKASPDELQKGWAMVWKAFNKTQRRRYG